MESYLVQTLMAALNVLIGMSFVIGAPMGRREHKLFNLTQSFWLCDQHSDRSVVAVVFDAPSHQYWVLNLSELEITVTLVVSFCFI